MTAAALDLATISQRLNSIEEQLHQLRGLLAGPLARARNDVATEHPYISASEA